MGTQGGSNKYPQCMFWIKKKKKNDIPLLQTPVFPSKVGV